MWEKFVRIPAASSCPANRIVTAVNSPNDIPFTLYASGVQNCGGNSSLIR